MCKSVLITINYFGTSTGTNFSLYSNVDSYAVPFQTGVTKTSLLTGHTSHQVPDSATTIKVKPESGNCIEKFSDSILNKTIEYLEKEKKFLLFSTSPSSRSQGSFE
jgi:hypothetical protein